MFVWMKKQLSADFKSERLKKKTDENSLENIPVQYNAMNKLCKEHKSH